jgi:hypothetical protein
MSVGRATFSPRRGFIHGRSRRGGMDRAKAILVAIMLGLSACSSGGDAPEASVAPSATPASVHVLDLSGCRQDVCEAPLEPGRYQARFYGRTLDFEIPAAASGWIWHSFYNFRFIADETPTEGLVTSDSINFLFHPRIATRDCEDTEDRSVGHSVDDIVSWLTAAPGLLASKRTPVTIGGLEGYELDLEIDPAWRRTCFFSEGMPAVPLVVHEAEWGAYNLTMLPDISMRWYVLDTDDDIMIIDIDDGPQNLSRRELFATSKQIVESFAFSPTP